MQLSQVFVGLGQETLGELLRSVSIGRLKTYQMFEPLKVRLHLNKLNSDSLRRSAARLWARLESGDDQLASDLSQAILISHMDMIQAVLNFLGIPHEEGFFAKDLDPASYLSDGWQRRVLDEFQGRFPAKPLLFYVNHLGCELAKAEAVFPA
jgi:hypothetical protein